MKASVPALILAFVLVACQNRYPQGENLYRAYCANCHMEDGSGLARLIPPLAGSDRLTELANTVCAIAHGAQGGVVVNGITYSEPMPSFRNLTPVEISNIVNYLHTSWGNALPPVNPAQVEAALDDCQEPDLR
ncbi:MAG: cytochrome c [Saprospiraceae bacterium]|nr:cytochrome c [Saprospiraceae bacterium]